MSDFAIWIALALLFLVVSADEVGATCVLL